MLAAITIFSVNIRIGREIIFSSQSGFTTFENIVLMTNAISELLEYERPKIVKSGSFVALEFNGKVIGYDGKSLILGEGKPSTPYLTPKEFLDYFYIPYLYEDGDYVIPECFIVSLKKIGSNIEVKYLGNPTFVYRMSGESLVVVSTGYVFYSGEIYPPGKIVQRLPMRGYEIGKVLEGEGKDIVELVRRGQGKRILVFPYGSNLIKPLSQFGIGVVLARGRGEVIVRTMAPELQGLDRDSFLQSKELGLKIAKELSYRFELCPVVGIPPGSVYLLILLKDVDDYGKVIDLVRELSGVEKSVDYTDSFDSLPLLER